MSSMCGFRPRFSWTTRMAGSFLPARVRRSHQIAAAPCRCPAATGTRRSTSRAARRPSSPAGLRRTSGSGRRAASPPSCCRRHTSSPCRESPGDRARRGHRHRTESGLPDRSRPRSVLCAIALPSWVRGRAYPTRSPDEPPMVLFSHMSDQWSGGIKTAKMDVVWDVSEAAPDVFAAVANDSPAVSAAMEGLRSGVPFMASAAPGEQGELYRIRGHNRSVCIALSGDKSTSDVVVIKGSEPLLPDFERYLDWMQFKSFGAWPRPMMEHFPLFEGKTPGHGGARRGAQGSGAGPRRPGRAPAPLRRADSPAGAADGAGAARADPRAGDGAAPPPHVGAGARARRAVRCSAASACSSTTTPARRSASPRSAGRATCGPARPTWRRARTSWRR